MSINLNKSDENKNINKTIYDQAKKNLNKSDLQSKSLLILGINQN